MHSFCKLSQYVTNLTMEKDWTEQYSEEIALESPLKSTQSKYVYHLPWIYSGMLPGGQI